MSLRKKLRKVTAKKRRDAWELVGWVAAAFAVWAGRKADVASDDR